MSLDLPKSFTLTRVSPSMAELEFMYEWCINNLPKGGKVLEFGAGPTTWAINKAMEPSKYVAVEDWIPTIKDVTLHLDNIEIIKTTWFDIPDDEYDLVFVDSSAGYPPGATGLHRDEAAKYGERLLAEGGYIMLHDWHSRSGRAPRKYLEGAGYKLVASFENKVGVGIYKHED